MNGGASNFSLDLTNTLVSVILDVIPVKTPMIPVTTVNGIHDGFSN
jgi:hypothetical protein